ncbi:MAG: hypothetical protein MJ223_00350 [Mycoplasmoidaceae bacterium]|nr:hypothetical protein [Mycoplasmoidaceae bacterium]
MHPIGCTFIKKEENMSTNKKYISVDGNTAAAMIGYALSDVACIFPITPSTPMAELCDE